MKRYLTIDDIIDVFHKLKQRGFKFILSKLNFKGIKRTEKTFNQLDYESADWYIIPKVKERWNLLITGKKDLDYKEYLVKNYLQNRKGLRLISLGSGACHHEIKLANNPSDFIFGIYQKRLPTKHVEHLANGANNKDDSNK